MSLLSTITSSLPNVLNLLQGEWDVQYKTAAEKQGNIFTKAADKVADAQAWLNSKESTNDGAEWKSLDFDSFLDIQEIDETHITQNPIEGGSFRSANKVKKPKQVKVTLAKGGIGYGIEDTLAEIKSLVPLARYKDEEKESIGLDGVIDTITNGLKSAAISTWNAIAPDKYDIKEEQKVNKPIPMEFRIITPFDMIKDLNLVKLDYTFKKDNGRNMLIMYLTFEEILEKKKKKVAKNATDNNNENVGRVSAQGSTK